MMNKTTSQPNQPRVLWEGDFFAGHSLALVNRELCSRLIGYGIQMQLVPISSVEDYPSRSSDVSLLGRNCFQALDAGPNVQVLHAFPPTFAYRTGVKRVLMQPWEYGSLPIIWKQLIERTVDEVWCNSSYVRDVYRLSGIPEEKLAYIPLGFDPIDFHPNEEEFTFSSADSDRLNDWLENNFIFLFVGGTIERKGIDLLISAYQDTFRRSESVCLVVKDQGSHGVYSNSNYSHLLRQLSVSNNGPKVILIEDELPTWELAKLYRSADCLVQPYRGEGFCLPVLEAMACGTPVLVTAGGSTDDFVDENTGWKLTAERQAVSGGRVGIYDCCSEPWLFNVKHQELVMKLRQIFNMSQSERDLKGHSAAQKAKDDWTWDHSIEAVVERLSALTVREEGTAALPADGGIILPKSASLAGVSASDSNANRRDVIRKLPTLSLCMIVRNEERVLDACLASISPYVDEIIIVDTGSTDSTMEIAANYTTKLFSFDWCDDFSAARNESVKHASSDWILWMDADDTIPAECAAELKNAVFLASDRVSGILMGVSIPAPRGEIGNTIVDHLKLFRNVPWARFEGRIHEQIMESLTRNGGQIDRSELYVVHSGYDYSPEGQTRKKARNLKLLELDLEERPQHPFVLFNAGMSHAHLGNYQEALSYLRQSLERSNPADSIVRKVFGLLVGCEMELQHPTEAQQWLEMGLGAYPHDPELLFRAGMLYRSTGRSDLAEAALIKLITNRDVGHIDIFDMTLAGHKAHHNLAMIYIDGQRWQEAIAQLETAVRLEPQAIESVISLAEIYSAVGRFDECATILEHLTTMDANKAVVLKEKLMQGQT